MIWNWTEKNKIVMVCSLNLYHWFMFFDYSRIRPYGSWIFKMLLYRTELPKLKATYLKLDEIGFELMIQTYILHVSFKIDAFNHSAIYLQLFILILVKDILGSRTRTYNFLPEKNSISKLCYTL